MTRSGDRKVNMGALSSSLGFLLRISEVRAYESFYHRFRDEDLKPGEYSVLLLTKLNPGIRPIELSRALFIKPAHMTKILRRLEKTGHITRVVPEDDRRSVCLDITPAGADWLEERKAAFFGVDNYHDHNLTSTEVEALAHLLRKYARVDE